MAVKVENQSHPQGRDPHQVPLVAALLCYVQLAIFLAFGHARDYLGVLFGSRYAPETNQSGRARLLVAWETFYTHRIYHRMQDAFFRPVTSAPSAYIDVAEREFIDGHKTMQRKRKSQPTGTDAAADGSGEDSVRHCLNLGSYNYLGFADDWMQTCSSPVLATMDQYGLASSSPPLEFGTTTVHTELEAAVARFVGKPAALVYNMGYATNATSLPALLGPGALIVSDSLNHNSLVTGARTSGASVAVFRHNSATHLEQVLRAKISEGQPRTHRRWTKILVVVEGIYSMEGEIVDLKRIVQVAKKYKAFTYVDEAHSIGALGRTGRGVCEYAGVDPSEVDILMGTFSKSFGAMGGYVAGSTELIAFMRTGSAGAHYATSLSPVIAQQISTTLAILDGRDGTTRGADKLVSLRDNSNYFRKKLMDMGVVTLGHMDSPVIPVMVYATSKILEFSRECLKRDLAVVTVGYPATPLLLARVRFCVSAAHTRADLDVALKKLEEVAHICHVRYQKNFFG